MAVFCENRWDLEEEASDLIRDQQEDDQAGSGYPDPDSHSSISRSCSLSILILRSPPPSGGGSVLPASQIEIAALQPFVLRDQATGTNHHVIFYYDAIQQNRTHANQYAIADSAAVKHHFMTDGNIFSNDQGIALRVIEDLCVTCRTLPS
jgi:hypothetical protein